MSRASESKPGSSMASQPPSVSIQEFSPTASALPPVLAAVWPAPDLGAIAAAPPRVDVPAFLPGEDSLSASLLNLMTAYTLSDPFRQAAAGYGLSPQWGPGGWAAGQPVMPTPVIPYFPLGQPASGSCP